MAEVFCQHGLGLVCKGYPEVAGSASDEAEAPIFRADLNAMAARRIAVAPRPLRHQCNGHLPIRGYRWDQIEGRIWLLLCAIRPDASCDGPLKRPALPMPHVPLRQADGIDAVITWVDGADPAHIRRRQKHMRVAVSNRNGTNPHRWACSNELAYCLGSIANHAPWIGRIWIVTDQQRPDLAHVPRSIRDRITIVDHRLLFAGYEAVLPTFNSMTIESMIWRIADLSERFVYFNDDVFLAGPIAPSDVFSGQKPVLRGKWLDLSRLLLDPAWRDDPAALNGFAQINAAAMLGFGADRLFSGAHVVHPMRKSVMAALFERFNAAFMANIAHRFRDIGQFLPQTLHNHACLLAGDCVLSHAPDHLHLRSGAVHDLPLPDVRQYLLRALQADIKFLCVNDLPQVEAAIPDTRAWIERAIAKAA